MKWQHNNFSSHSPIQLQMFFFLVIRIFKIYSFKNLPICRLVHQCPCCTFHPNTCLSLEICPFEHLIQFPPPPTPPPPSGPSKADLFFYRFYIQVRSHSIRLPLYISLRKMPSRPRFPFYDWVIFRCASPLSFTHWSVDGHFGCCHVLVIVNNAATNRAGQASLPHQDFTSLR